MTLNYADIRDFDDRRGLSLLPEGRRERALRFLKREDRVRCLVAGLLLRHFVGDENSFQYTQHGKPFLAGGPSFNLSHSGDYVTLAVSSSDVGVDIEQILPWSEKVAARCYRESEQSWLHAQVDRTEAFYVLWTAKEAIMKASGRGFSMPPETFSVDPRKPWNRDAEKREWWLSWTRLPGHEVCVAASAPDTLSMVRATREELL